MRPPHVVRRPLVALAAALALAGCGNDRPVEERDHGTWTRKADLPGAARWSPLAVRVGHEVLVIGGGDESPCPPSASCIRPDHVVRSGAAYDPAKDTWRPIADAPRAIDHSARSAVVGDTLVLHSAAWATGGSTGRWLAYDVSDDRWRDLPAPPAHTVDDGALTTRDGAVHALGHDGRVYALGVAQDTWHALPADPTKPALDAESVVATPAGVLVSGPASSDPEDGDTPRFVVVDRWDGHAWSRLGRTGQITSSWQWTGDRLVTFDPQHAPGLDGNPPLGGTLDPSTGTWEPLRGLPDPERRQAEGWSPVAADGPHLAGWGVAWDDEQRRSIPLGRPDGTDVDIQQGAAWFGDELLLFGGLDTRIAYGDRAGLSREVWAWHPPKSWR